MRKASMILGIVGGSLAIIGSIILVVVGLMVGAVAYHVEYAATNDTQLESTAAGEADSYIYKTPEGDAAFYMPHGMRGGFFIAGESWSDDEDCPVWKVLPPAAGQISVTGSRRLVRHTAQWRRAS